jgi:hypothetical protein
LSVCVFYDCETVGDDELRRGLEAAPGGAEMIHVVADDAMWSVTDARASASVPSAHSRDFRMHLMELVDDLASQARAVRSWRDLLTAGGLDLLEVAYYDWVEALGPAAYRAWVLGRLRRDHSPQALVWVDGQRRRWPSLAAAVEDVGPGSAMLRADLGSDGSSDATAPHLRRSSGLRRLASLASSEPRRLLSLLRAPVVDVSAGEEDHRILFVENYPAGTRISAAVAAELEGRGGVAYRFLAASEEARAAAAPFCQATRETEAASRPARLRAWRHAARTARLGREAGVALAHRGGDQWAALRFLASEVGAATSKAWAQAASHTWLLDDVARRFRPHVVTTSSYTGSFARAAVLAGRARSGSAGVYLQHAVLFQYNYGMHLVHDRYLLWGERDKRRLVELGPDPEHVKVIGSPTLEPVSVRRQEELPQTTTEAGTGGEAFRVLYLPSRSGGGLVSLANARAMLDAVLHATSTLDGARLTIKVHPRDRSPVFDGLESEAVTVTRDVHPLDAIADSDVVISSTSTAGLEACALERPTVILELPGVTVASEYAQLGAALIARNRDELARCLLEIRDREDTRNQLAEGRRRLVEELFAGLAPGAARRGADELVTVAGEVRGAGG